MAAQSSKKTASANARTLKELHLVSFVINVLALLALIGLHRPQSKWAYFVFSVPAFFSQYTLEKSGRPTYGTDPATGYTKLIRSGDDIKGPGLFEYMFDCIYVTWMIDLLMVVLGTNYVWWLYSVIPGYVAYKGAKLAKSFFGKGGAAPSSTSTSSDATAASGKSKRQTKLEARRDKGQPQFKRR